MTRREWIAMISSAPLLKAAETAAPAAPVSIAKCASYDEDLTAKLAAMFDQLGGLEKLVRNKTVTVKVNMTGSPGQRVQGKAPAITHYTHPKLLGAAANLMGRAGAKRIRFVESSWATAGPLEETMLDSGWNVRSLQSAAPAVEFENTNALGKGKRYSRFKVPGTPYMYPAYDLNHAYEDTDVYVSMAKLKEHETCGITLSCKNVFGTIPASIYGDDAGVGRAQREPNLRAAEGRARRRAAAGEIGAAGAALRGQSRSRLSRAAYRGGPGGGASDSPGDYRRGGDDRGRRRSVDPRRQDRAARACCWPGLNPVCTDAVGAAVMGYNPRATRGTAPFQKCDNILQLAEAHGVGTTDLSRIDVRGVPIEQAMYKFRA